MSSLSITVHCSTLRPKHWDPNYVYFDLLWICCTVRTTRWQQQIESGHKINVNLSVKVKGLQQIHRLSLHTEMLCNRFLCDRTINWCTNGIWTSCGHWCLRYLQCKHQMVVSNLSSSLGLFVHGRLDIPAHAQPKPSHRHTSAVELLTRRADIRHNVYTVSQKTSHFVIFHIFPKY